MPVAVRLNQIGSDGRVGQQGMRGPGVEWWCSMWVAVERGRGVALWLSGAALRSPKLRQLCDRHTGAWRHLEARLQPRQLPPAPTQDPWLPHDALAEA